MAKYNDLIGLINLAAFLDEIAVCVVKYATWLVGQAGAATFNQGQWARSVLKSNGMPRNIATQISWMVAQDPIFLNQATAIDPTTMLKAVTDAQLQSAVETVINNGFAI